MALRNALYAWDLVRRSWPAGALGMGLQVLVVLLAFPWFRAYCFALTTLPAHAYLEPVILAEIIHRPLYLVAVFAASMAALCLGFRSVAWRTFDQPSVIRYFIVFLTAILAWAFATYDVNLYFDQIHFMDRTLLVVLVFLVWLNPLFIPIFLLETMVIVNQFQYPLQEYSWTDKRVVFDLLMLFSLFLFLKVMFKRSISTAFWFTALCLFASMYFVPGWGKLTIDWLHMNQLANLFVASYANGWLAFMEPEQLLAIGSVLKSINGMLLVATLFVEVGAILILFKRPLAIAILVMCIVLHVMIFLSSGIFFWKWILTAGVFIWVLAQLDEAAKVRLFNARCFVASLVVIWFSSVWLSPPKLAWYDTNFSTAYDMEAIGRSGKRYTVSRGFMAPYDISFAQNRFFYLNDEKSFAVTYGGLRDADVAAALENVKEAEEVLKLEQELGTNRYDEERARKFDEFVRRFFGNLNRGRSKSVASMIAAPHHIWSFQQGSVFERQEAVQTIEVRLRKSWYDGERIETLGDEVIRVIDIPAADGPVEGVAKREMNE